MSQSTVITETVVAPLTRLSKLDLSRTLVFREILAMGIDSLRADKVRAAMTALGMAVGTAALILVVTVALTGKRYVMAQIENVGTNVIWAEYSGLSGAGASSGIADYLTAKDMTAVEQQVPGVKEASPVLNLHQRMVVGSGKEREILVLGVDPAYQPVRRIVASAGRFFDEEDSQAADKVALITEALARTEFGSLDAALGQPIKIQEVPFVIIGTFRESVDTMGRSEIEDDTVLIPYSVARSMTGNQAVNQIYFSMYNASGIPAATDRIQEILASRHRPGSVYTVNNMTDVLRLANKTAAAFTAILLLFAAVTLVAAGIGIMNIMMATVHTRIHEIGVRKAVGATRRAILLQFLCEAVLIALLGGAVGTAIGIGIPISIQLFTDHYVPVSVLSALIALLVSCVVGITFGITPANNAARLDPVECLRHE
ncbi:MAG TPA: ABC transporter permease [Terriglobales bacterium]|jgi:putative ABC transport system permease protein|nr:ABC transporter permease [Terriglobales bacterium]